MNYLIFLNCPVLLETAGGQNDECPVQKLVTTTLWHYYGIRLVRRMKIEITICHILCRIPIYWVYLYIEPYTLILGCITVYYAV